MIIRNVDVPPEWEYLFETAIVKQTIRYTYEALIAKSAKHIQVYAYLKPEYVQQYQTYS